MSLSLWKGQIPFSLPFSLSPTPFHLLSFQSSHIVSYCYWQIQEAMEDNFTYQCEAKLTQSLINTMISSLPYKVYVPGFFLWKAVHSVHVDCILRVFGIRAVGSWLDDQWSDPWMKGSSLWLGFKLIDPKTLPGLVIPKDPQDTSYYHSSDVRQQRRTKFCHQGESPWTESRGKAGESLPSRFSTEVTGTLPS